MSRRSVALTKKYASAPSLGAILPSATVHGTGRTRMWVRNHKGELVSVPGLAGNKPCTRPMGQEKRDRITRRLEPKGRTA